MSKYDELLKKVNLFEKLAVYGDRSSFLKSLAQPGPTSYPGDVEDVYGKQPTATPAVDPAQVYNQTIETVQKQLNYLLFGDPNDRVMPFPLQTDGKLGGAKSKTNEALAIFRREYPKAATLTGQALYNYIGEMYRAVQWAESNKQPKPKQ